MQPSCCIIYVRFLRPSGYGGAADTDVHTKLRLDGDVDMHDVRPRQSGFSHRLIQSNVTDSSDTTDDTTSGALYRPSAEMIDRSVLPIHSIQLPLNISLLKFKHLMLNLRAIKEQRIICWSDVT